ncbi:MAG: type IV secretion system protein [Alphaproteobacteria bacterium]|jgi:type IV secretion system protein VirB8|nr:type IV secretion system protein [Alphaproteobacteria bacterium]
MAIKGKLSSFFSKVKATKPSQEQIENIKAVKDKTKSKIINLFDKDKFININDNSRTDTKVTQIVLFAFFMSLIFNFMLVVVILILLPLKEKVPYFVHFLPKDEQVVYVEPYKQSKTSLRAVKEFLARDYVKKRETIDLASENDRWNLVMFLSNNEVKSSFYSLYQESPDSPYKWAVDNNIIRTINIISSSVLNDNQYQVEYEMIDSFKPNGKVISTTIAIATVRFEENTEILKGQDYLNNPFSYLVSDYSIGIKQQRVETDKGINLKKADKPKKEEKSSVGDW